MKHEVCWQVELSDGSRVHFSTKKWALSVKEGSLLIFNRNGSTEGAKTLEAAYGPGMWTQMWLIYCDDDDCAL